MPDSAIIDGVEALHVKKQRAAMNQHCREFVAHSPFLVLGGVGGVPPMRAELTGSNAGGAGYEARIHSAGIGERRS